MGLFSLVGKIKIEGARESRADLEAVKSSVSSVAGSFVGLSQSISAQGSRITSVMAGVKAAGVAMAAQIATAGASAAVEAAASYDSLVRGLATVSTGAEDLKGQLARLQNVSKMPGLGFSEAVKGSLQLQAVGASAKLAENLLGGFGNAVARAGGGKADFAEALKQMTQIASAGKLTQENLGVIAERIPGFGNIIKSAFGSMDYEEINKQGLTGVQILEKFAGALGKLPKASGGIRNAMDNMGDTLNQKLYVPLGRVAAAFSGAFGASLERLLNAAAPGFERMAAAAERLSRTNLSKFFASTVGDLNAFNRAVSITAGILAAIAVGRAIPTIVSGVMAMVNAFRALRVALQSVAIADIIMEAIATKGASLVAVGAAISVGVGVAAGLNKQLNDLFDQAGSSSGPSIPQDMSYSKVSLRDALNDTVNAALQQAQKAQEEKSQQMSRYLLAIERNTAKAAQALDMRRQTLGGSELGKLGVTPSELGRAVYAPPDTFSRHVSSEQERVTRKVIQQELSRKGIHARPRHG